MTFEDLDKARRDAEGFAEQDDDVPARNLAKAYLVLFKHYLNTYAAAVGGDSDDVAAMVSAREIAAGRPAPRLRVTTDARGRVTAAAVPAAILVPESIVVGWGEGLVDSAGKLFSGWVFDLYYVSGTHEPEQGRCDSKPDNTASGLFDAIQNACARAAVSSTDYSWRLIDQNSAKGVRKR